VRRYSCGILNQTMIRFIIDTPQSAAFNMAADQFLLEQCPDSSTVYVRFYLWAKPTITLGYMQKPADVLNFKRIEADQVSWIKRPTGGRAVLHDKDLTYSCIFPNNLAAMGSTVKESYRIITECLLKGLLSLGIPCQAHDSYEDILNLKREVKLPCFLAPNRDEIMVDGKKLVGSAQKRSIKGVLQHGSIPFSDHFRRLPLYLNVDEKEREMHQTLLRSKSIGLQEINRSINCETLISALKEGFITRLGFPWIRNDWTDNEKRKIHEMSISEEFVNQWLS